jgi:hypothetical protein
LIEKLEGLMHRNDENFKQLKNVLRIPRLYHQYTEIMNEFVNGQQLKLYLESKHALDENTRQDIGEYEKSCLKTALAL